MRRVYVNVAAFVVLATGTILWSVVNFLHLDVVERPYLVVAEFDQSPGLRSGYEVTYLGHAIGRIRDVRLVPGMSEVELAIDRDVEIPADLTAAARRRSAIGEPYVDLSPASGTDPDRGSRLIGGDRIPLSRTSSPLQYGDLFRTLDTLVETIDAAALRVVTEELAAAVDGRGDELRAIVSGTADLTSTLSENGDAIEDLVDGVADIADVLATNRDSLGSGIERLAELTEVLEAARPSVEVVIDEGPSTLAIMNAIVDAADHAVICTIDGTAALDAVLDAEALRSLRGLLERSAPFADVIRLVQDPRDGIFRLFVSPSGGEPPTVEYAEKRPFPTTPELEGCPQHEVSVAGARPTDEASEPGGGQRSGDGSSSAVPPRADPRPGDLASGTSDAEPADSVLSRLASALWPELLILVLGAGGGAAAYLAIRRWRAT